MFFSVIAKKLNWEILTKNEKDGIGLRMKNFKILMLWGFTEKSHS